jgi:signal transduction histidine kinase
MLDRFGSLFSSSSFLPHGYCFTWTPTLLWSMVGADAVIAAAYYSIPLALIVLVRKRRDLSFNWLVLMFSGFIFACGTTHLVAIWTIWHPDYWLDVLVKTLTAAISIVTALMLWRLIPKVLRIPSLGDMQAAQDELAKVNAELQLRIAEAERARAVAEEASHAKSEFLSRMSHELRTPLNAVLGFAQLSSHALERGETEALPAHTRHIQDAGWHLLDLINDILDLSRIEQGQHGVELADVALPGVIDDAAALVQSQAEKSEVHIAIELADALPPLRADRTRLVQVLTNLMSNAIKFNRPGGEVRVRARRDGSQVLLEVADNGIGMTRQQQTELFQPFNRLGRERLGIPGTGIGLVLVRHLVELMGGTLGLASEVERGTMVRLRFATASVGEQPALLREAHDDRRGFEPSTMFGGQLA